MAIKHQIRAKGDGKVREVLLTPTKAIHFWCIECNGFSSHKVKECSDHHCPLWVYRRGCDPSRKRGPKESDKRRAKEPITS
jgi:hypothetical protein